LEEQLTTSQVATLLGVSDETIRKWIAAGKLPGYRITDDSWYRVNRRELEEYARKRGFSLDWSLVE
jgi:excisionase family DNA binding protein